MPQTTPTVLADPSLNFAENGEARAFWKAAVIAMVTGREIVNVQAVETTADALVSAYMARVQQAAPISLKKK